MTLEQCYQTHEGESIDFDGTGQNNGQCVQWADTVLTQVYAQTALYANAIDWWENSQLDSAFDFIPYTEGIYPVYGDFVIWGSGVGSKYGHIDLAANDGDAGGFAGYDSNWEDIPTLRTIEHNYDYGILGYIRLKGVNMQPTENQIILAYKLAFGPTNPPTQEQITAQLGQPDLSHVLSSLEADSAKAWAAADQGYSLAPQLYTKNS